LTREYKQAVTFRVVAQIDENVDLVRANEFGQRVIVEIGHPVPEIGVRPNRLRYRIRPAAVVIAENRKPRMIVRTKHWGGKRRHRMLAQIGRDVTNSQSPLWVWIVLILCRRWKLLRQPRPVEMLVEYCLRFGGDVLKAEKQ